MRRWLARKGWKDGARDLDLYSAIVVPSSTEQSLTPLTSDSCLLIPVASNPPFHPRKPRTRRLVSRRSSPAAGYIAVIVTSMKVLRNSARQLYTSGGSPPLYTCTRRKVLCFLPQRDKETRTYRREETLNTAKKDSLTFFNCFFPPFPSYGKVELDLSPEIPRLRNCTLLAWGHTKESEIKLHLRL